ncbi:MAG: c-type cytochrome domain-containing protein [Opitutaceae bacterium]
MRAPPDSRRAVFSALLVFVAAAHAAEPGARKVTYEDDVLPVFRDNCLKCHNPDKLKGDLDLTSFAGVLKGGGSGPALNSGDPEGSMLFRVITHAEEPTMPPNGKLAERDIAVIRRWIQGGVLQGLNSKAIAASKPAADLALKSVATGRPEGPPPLPGRLPLEPAVRARANPAITALAHSPWAPVLAVSGARQVVLHRTDKLEFAGVLPFAEGAVHELRFSRNGRLLLAAGGRGGHSGGVVVWDITSGERVITIGDQYDSVLAADLSADQQWVALGGPDRVLKIYRTRDGGLEHRIRKHTDWVTAVEFSPDGRWLASGDRNGGLFLWEADTGQELFALNGHKGAISGVSWRADSAMLASAGEDGTVKLWKAADGAALRSITAHPGGALAVRFGPDGKLVTGGRDNKVQVWETGGRNVRTFASVIELPNRVAFSDDGARVVAGDWQGRVSVWETQSGRALEDLDANPPPLAARVQLCYERLEKMKAAVAKTRQEMESAEAAEKRAAQAAAKARQALADSKGSSRTGLEKALAAAAKEEAAATRRLGDAKAALNEAETRLERAVASLEHWLGIVGKSAVLETGPSGSIRRS